MKTVHVVFLSQSPTTPPAFCLGAWADKTVADKKAEDMNKMITEKEYSKGFYRVQEVRFHDFEVNEDDF